MPKHNPYAYKDILKSSHQVPVRSSGRLRFAIGVAALANLLSFGVIATLISVRPGTIVMPMSHAMAVLLITAVAFAISAPICLHSLVLRGGYKSLALVGFLLSLSPFWVGHVTMHVVAHLVGFTLD